MKDVSTEWVFYANLRRGFVIYDWVLDFQVEFGDWRRRLCGLVGVSWSQVRTWTRTQIYDSLIFCPPYFARITQCHYHNIFFRSQTTPDSLPKFQSQYTKLSSRQSTFPNIPIIFIITIIQLNCLVFSFCRQTVTPPFSLSSISLIFLNFVFFSIHCTETTDFTEASPAPAAMDWGNVTAEDLIDALREVDWSSPPRPLSEFFSRFTIPRSSSKWNSRLKCNLY